MFHTHFDPERMTWSGLKTVPTYNPNVSVAKVVLDMLKMNPNKIGQVRKRPHQFKKKHDN